MQDELLQEHSCAVCGSRLMPLDEGDGETADFREQGGEMGDRWICPACRTYLLYAEGSRDEA